MLTRFMRAAAGLLTMFMAVAPAMAQQPDLVVGQIPFPKREWGTQNVAFEIKNNSSLLKFVVVETDITFEGSYVNPQRIHRANYVVVPEATTTVNAQVEIPSNYGDMNLVYRLYDVVDTLDDLSLGRKFFEQPFLIKFRTPQDMIPYFQERITLPPAVGEHGPFDNELARLLPVMLNEGKTFEEIATLAGTDTTFIRQLVERLTRLKFLRLDNRSYVPAFPIISNEYARDARVLADSVSGRLARLIQAQFPERRRVIDSLLKAGSITGDTNNFYKGAQLLYLPYPLVSVVCLWRELGTHFVLGQGNLMVFDNTDPCNGLIQPYMYFTLGGDYYNGHQYYDANMVQNGLNCRFGDTIPTIECEPDFEKTPKSWENGTWRFPEAYRPEAFLMDTAIVLPACRAILKGADPVVDDAIAQLRHLSMEHDNKGFTVAERYWFWDLTATLTTEKLIDAGVITKLRNGQYNVVSK